MNQQISANDMPVNNVFHRGEREIQRRAGVDEKMAANGAKVIRPYMPDQHREFFAQLPMLLVGSVDQQGQPWASVLCAAPGFVNSPDPEHLHVQAFPLHADPLEKNLSTGAALGVLGIELPTRRRNRMNGHVCELNADGFAIKVDQSFGNCPKYIQTRSPRFVESEQPGMAPRVSKSLEMNARMRAIINQADTYFIASANLNENTRECSFGVDVSHRGGKPGFVRIDDNVSLTAPEFVGNFFFNTTGNIAVYPRAGLLFIDFQNGDLLYLTTEAKIIWDGADLTSFAGAQRLLHYRLREAILVKGSLPLRWGEAAISPYLEATGNWDVR